MYKASIVHLVPSCCRWVWNVSLHAELLYTLSDVHILWNGSFRTKIPKISVVEEVHDFYADCKCRGIYFSYYFVHCRKLTVGLVFSYLGKRSETDRGFPTMYFVQCPWNSHKNSSDNVETSVSFTYAYWLQTSQFLMFSGIHENLLYLLNLGKANVLRVRW